MARAWALIEWASVKHAPADSSGFALTRVPMSSSAPSAVARVRSTAAPALCGAMSGGETYRLAALNSSASDAPGLPERSSPRYSSK